MESNQKWVNLSFLAGAGLIGFVVFLLASRAAAALDFDGRFGHLESSIKIGAVVVGALCFLLLYRSKSATLYMDEVFIELNKVTWPQREETTKGTIAVLIAVTVMGFMFGLVDWLWSHIVNVIM